MTMVYVQTSHFDPHVPCLLWYQYDKENVIEARFRELEQEGCNIKSLEQSLANNTDLLACKAEYYHQCGEYQKCFELTSV